MNKSIKENLTRQELFCHNCGKYVQFTIDQNLDGRHVLQCPKCKHEHCRIIKDGKITDERWASRNDYMTASNGTMITYYATNIEITNTSTYDSYSDGIATYTTIDASDSTTSNKYFLYQNWSNLIG